MQFVFSVSDLINAMIIAGGIGVCGLCFLQISASGHLRKESMGMVLVDSFWDKVYAVPGGYAPAAAKMQGLIVRRISRPTGVNRNVVQRAQ